MRVLEVQLRDFRTYARAQASLGESLTVVHGPNGAGKSNLLEALYFGCTGRSTRTRNERELIRFGAQTTRVSLALSDGGRAHQLSVAYGALDDGARSIKRMAADGVSVERLLDVAHRPLVSVFVPDRLGLLKGPPSLRRAHLDQLIAAIWPLRAEVRRSYARALAQRNALLARARSGSATAAALPAWDRELATHAVALRAHRAQAVALLEQPLSQRASELGCAGSVQLEYRPGTAASPSGRLPMRIGTLLRVRGSILTTRWPNSAATQSAPLPNASADGLPATGIVARTASVVGSSSETVPSSSLATQTARSP